MKTKSEFVCNACGYNTAKWMGKCAGCGEWNTLVEFTTSKASKQREQQGFVTLSSDKVYSLDEISTEDTPRYQTHVNELDRVLGGGLVPGSLVLLGGDPGIGKSTLVIEMLNRLALNHVSVLYVTGEESKEQIKMRAERLGITANLMIVAENNLDRVLKHIDTQKPQVVVIDSIQTIFLPHLESAPGTVSQVRECTSKLLFQAKSSLTTALLIGHVTKEGAIAGPRVLEHMVDTVLYFEGETSGQFRILRTIKNRYGSTNEIGVFEMTGVGLSEVKNPSAHFLSGRAQDVAGSCVTASVEGTRPILTEVQSLVSHSPLANPRRTAIGIDHNRLALIVAVLEKIANINLYNQDIYVNAAGGLKLTEPSSDLAILLSVLSSHHNKPLPTDLIAFGEMGLTGEIRPVAYGDVRLIEAQKLGYKKIVLPQKTKFAPMNDVEIIKVNHINQVIEYLF